MSILDRTATELVFAAVLVFTTIVPADADDVSVIPQPVSLSAGDGVFAIRPTTAVIAEGPAAAEATKLADYLAPAMGFRLPLRSGNAPQDGAIALLLDAQLKAKGDEAYRLEVSPQRIVVRAKSPTGLFYGVQTLRQLLPPAALSEKPVEGIAWNVPCVVIDDHPRFGWRGLLIDPARHFIPVADFKHYIDAMALHKFNRLQVHFTDNEGWRIEIKKYPKLTQIGSQMDWNLRHRGGKGPRCFGYYTQGDIRELVRYAAERHITIVPEIEMPYHAGSAIMAYPEHGVNMKHLAELPPGERWKERRGDWRPNSGLLGPRPATVAFMQDILTEVMDLFPSEFIHIGGDEANLQVWTNDPEMQALMKQLDCADAHALHSWFIQQMDAFLTQRGRRMVGWDEILQGGLAEGATVMSWRGEAGGITAAKAGHDVVMAPTSHTYFDYYQGPREKEPVAIGGHVPVEKVYQYEPVPAALDAQQARHVLGAQAQLWGEFIATPEHRDYMTWPRASAFCEVVWSPKDGRDRSAFMDRLERHLERLDAMGIHYRPLDPPLLPVSDKPDAGAPQAVRELAQRLLSDRADEFVFELIPPAHGRDVFEIESRDATIVIRGNTGVAMATGLGWYLKHSCRCHVSWFGQQMNLPEQLPEVHPKIRQITWARHRYFLNYCCFGYSLPWWDWDQWESLIDWMALNGVNAPLSVTGQEAVWQAVCRELGMSEAQIGEFLAGPPYLPFQWMGCLDGWGGPLPQSWIERHEQLQKKIVERQRALGMTPVLQGFTGHVPAALAKKFPDAKLHKIHWIEWNTHLLDPLDPLYPTVAKLFMQEQTKRFGTDHLYAADTFIEMTPPSGEPKFLADLSRSIYDGMAASDPDAVWVLQGWTFFNQRHFWTQDRVRAFLDAIPDERMLVLDLFCESTPMWERTEAFYGKPWLWCNVQNFGCAVHLGGAVPRNNDGLMAARMHPGGGKLAGLGFVNEGLGYNPAVYDQMFEMAWRDRPVDLDQWFTEYARYRYGAANPSTERAWRILKDCVYTAPCRTRSVIDRLPTLKRVGGPPYENAQVGRAWRLLLDAADEFGQCDAYQFDLANVARQALSNHAAALHAEVVDACEQKDAQRLAEASTRFLQLFVELDELLGTRREFLLGSCLEDAKRWGTNDDERAILQWNARRVLTLWGQGPPIDDYARKEWSGMIRGYYLPRWQPFLEAAAESLEGDKPLDQAAFHRELRTWMTQWSDGQETYPSEPTGDTVAVARRLWDKYGDAFKPDALSLTTDKPVTCSAALPPHPARLANDGFAGNTDRYWAMDTAGGDPAWWQVDLLAPTTVGRVVVVGYFGDRRYYGFTVETSADGKTWQTAADRRDNQQPSTSEGYTCRFDPRPVRYLRITQPINSANTGRHLVEVMAYPE